MAIRGRPVGVDRPADHRVADGTLPYRSDLAGRHTDHHQRAKSWPARRSHPRGKRHLTEGSTTGWWAPRTLAVSMPVLREERGPHAHAGRRRGSTRTQEARVVVFGDRPSSRW